MANNLYGSNWTDERIDQLKEMAAANMSAREIANALGVSRNSVLGKSFRLGIKREKIARPERAAPIDPQVKRQREIDRVRRQHGSKPPQERKPPPPFAGTLDIPFGDLRRFSDSTPNECRYIEGDSHPFAACGTETLPGKPYCAHHHAFTHKASNLSEEDRNRRAKQAIKNWFATSVRLTGIPAEAA